MPAGKEKKGVCAYLEVITLFDLGWQLKLKFFNSKSLLRTGQVVADALQELFGSGGLAHLYVVYCGPVLCCLQLLHTLECIDESAGYGVVNRLAGVRYDLDCLVEDRSLELLVGGERGEDVLGDHIDQLVLDLLAAGVLQLGKGLQLVHHISAELVLELGGLGLDHLLHQLGLVAEDPLELLKQGLPGDLCVNLGLGGAHGHVLQGPLLVDDGLALFLEGGGDGCAALGVDRGAEEHEAGHQHRLLGQHDPLLMEGRDGQRNSNGERKSPVSHHFGKG
mmetsp:Transcript_2171/g.3206  ORF Transcript_2171/g.3206 Transcript_2171/m.3206 type:complete len:278 (-) Transcript_2171:257-1090(-)